MVGHRHLNWRQTMFAVKKAIQTSFLKLAPNNNHLLHGIAYKIENFTIHAPRRMFFPHPIFYRMWDMQKRISLNVSWCLTSWCAFFATKKENSRVLLEGLIVLKQNHTVMEKRNHISFPFVTRMHKKPKFHYLYRKASQGGQPPWTAKIFSGTASEIQ